MDKINQWIDATVTNQFIETTADVVTIITLLILVRQLKSGAITMRAQFWLLFREVTANYDDVHANLRPGGEWHASCDKPLVTDVKSWASIELYMGLFEYCEYLLKKGLLDKKQFQSWYEYRIKNLLTNRRIVYYKLILEKKDWSEFIALCKRLKIDIPEIPNDLITLSQNELNEVSSSQASSSPPPVR